MATVLSPSGAYGGAIHSEPACRMMTAGGVLPAGRTSFDLLDAVAQTIAGYDQRWCDPEHAARFTDAFVEAMHAGRVTIGTPALTNVWSADRPFASCTAVPIGAPATDGADAARAAEDYYLDNMGSGWNLDSFADPIDTLLDLNDHAAHIQESGACERYVGNLAHLSARHPRIHDFVQLKGTRPLPHFNLSVNFGTEDLAALDAGDPTMVGLLEEIAIAAWRCGDPGVICLDRFNSHNPLREESPYTTTAPCAEVGLAPGDTCLFAYLNLAAFMDSTDLADYDIDALRRTVGLAVRALDDLLDAGEHSFVNSLSRDLSTTKRRIGLAVCGYADLLVWAGLPYGTPDALTLLANLLGVVHYEAVATSIALARQRGPFAAFAQSTWAAGTQPPPPPTHLVTVADWNHLFWSARVSGLRHSSLTALPPSGRSAILLGVNPSIEPFLADPRSSAASPALAHHAGGQPDAVLRTATKIDWRTHLQVTSTAAAFVDESVSKTVNLAPQATPDTVKSIFAKALRAGLKAISVYRPHP